MNHGRRPRIVVIGSSNTDMVVRTPRIPAAGETVLGGDFLMVAGGKGANQAVAASRLGGDVSLVARLGADLFGDRALASIAAAGVITRYTVRDSGAASGVALICVDEGGQNAIVVAPGANGRLSAADVDDARPAIESADVVVLQFESPMETVRHAIDLAKGLGKLVIVNPAPAQAIPAGYLTGVDVVTPNEIEAVTLLGDGSSIEGLEDGARAARRLREVTGVGAAIVTLDVLGAAYATVEDEICYPSLRVEAVDSTAAGDCFTGALAVALGEGRALSEAVVFANTAAGISVTRLGAQTSMPTRAEVEQWLTR